VVRRKAVPVLPAPLITKRLTPTPGVLLPPPEYWSPTFAEVKKDVLVAVEVMIPLVVTVPVKLGLASGAAHPAKLVKFPITAVASAVVPLVKVLGTEHAASAFTTETVKVNRSTNANVKFLSRTSPPAE
jgi:hypothetical protein